MKRFLVILNTILLAWCVAYAEPSPSVVGTWKLVNMERQHAQGKAEPYCLSPNGLLTYTSQGYMSVSINCMKSAADKQLTPDLSKAIFYAGTYSINGHTMLHHIINANTVDFFGKDISRDFEFKDGNKIVFTGKASSGDLSRLVWERIAP